jgi:hypothetical protein
MRSSLSTELASKYDLISAIISLGFFGSPCESNGASKCVESKSAIFFRKIFKRSDIEYYDTDLSLKKYFDK